MRKLRGQGETLYITPQVLVEFHALTTRPVTANGWGLSPRQALLEARKIEALFPVLDETPAIFPLWRSLVRRHNVVGRQVFDARLVAVMQAYGIPKILTLNASDFRRFSAITVVEPQNV